MRTGQGQVNSGERQQEQVWLFEDVTQTDGP